MNKIAISVLFLLCITAVAWASPMSEGKDFMKAGMYREAAEKFDKVIRGDSARGLRADPTNAEAHFLLGECYLKQGMSGQADERFSSAIKVDRSYGPKTAALYEATGWSLFNSNPSGANEMFHAAMKYDPGKRASIAEKLFDAGKRQNFETAFQMAVQHSPSIGGRVGDYYWDAANKTTDAERAWGLKVLAKKYNPSAYGAEVAKEAEQKASAALESAKKEARIPDETGSKLHENETNRLKALAIRYYNDAGKDGKAIVEKELPEHIRYGVGEHDLGEYKKGEQTPFWFSLEGGSTYYTRFATDCGLNFKNFKVLVSNGEEYHIWIEDEAKTLNSKSYMNEKFRILFVMQDCGVTFKVKTTPFIKGE